MGKFLEIAKTILLQENRPLRINEIIELAREKGYLDFSEGLTPDLTIKARITENIKRKKHNSDFKRIGPGLFVLRNFNAEEYDAVSFSKRIRTNEHVLVFKTSLLGQIGLFNGIKSKNYQRYLNQILDKKNTFFIPRLTAEKDITRKQILSYIIVEKNRKVLRFVRGVYTNAHSMLRGSLCIGFGGHVQNPDLNLFEVISNDHGYLNSVKRELLEELKISEESINNRTLKIIGILNDDSSEVGKSHFAIIHKLSLNDAKTKDAKKLKGEKSINQLTFLPINDLGNDFEKYEYWSKLCIKEYYKSFIKLDCKIHRVKNYSLSKHPKVIVIVGSIGSGKTEASKILENNFYYKFISSGKVLQEIMNLPPLKKIGRSKFQEAAMNFISSEAGPSILANKILGKMDLTSSSNYVIDGIRNIKTFNVLKSVLGNNLTLIFVESTPDNCYKFYKRREGDLDIYTFFRYLNHTVEGDIKYLLGIANLVFYNHGSLSSFQTQIKKFFKLELLKHE